MAEHARWQIQEAKHASVRSSAWSSGRDPQIITRHGDEVAVIIAIEEYRRLAKPKRDLKDVLLGPPYVDNDVIDDLGTR